MQTSDLKQRILCAARADTIPIGEAGLWSVKKFRVPVPLEAPRSNGQTELIPPGIYTSLTRWTNATMNHGQGELVMHDCPAELKKHLQFMLMAHGRVLVTGLGLGCVARGLLANPAVKFVVVIERDADVLKLVGPHMPTERISIIHADAIEWVKKNTNSKHTFDCAWHDIWTDISAGERDLVLAHNELICDLAGQVKLQGAWEFPRYIRRRMREVFNVI